MRETAKRFILNKYFLYGVILLLTLLSTPAAANIIHNPYSVYTDEKIDTILGSLPHPIKIFHDEQGRLLGIDPQNNRIPLPLPQHVPFRDTSHGDYAAYIDKYSDRIFFSQNNAVRYYDLKTNTFTTLPDAIRTQENEVEIAYASENYLVLQTDNPGNDFLYHAYQYTTFSIPNGKKSDDSVYLFTDSYTQDYVVFLSDSWYRIVVDYTLHGRNYSAPQSTLRIYQIPVTEQQLADYLALIAADNIREIWQSEFPFRHTIEKSLPWPILKIKTKLPQRAGKQGGNTFRIRTMYKVDATKIAIEIDTGMALIDLAQQSAEYIDHSETVKTIRLNAMPLSLYFEGNHEAYCDDFIDFPWIPPSKNLQFVFCLE